LENKTQFLNFNKKSARTFYKNPVWNKNHKTDLFASAALVRGQYAKVTDIIGQETTKAI
jgi:hypothetical protein